MTSLFSLNAQNKDNVTETKADSNGYVVFDGDTAPDFQVTLTDGSSVRLSDLRGKVVMLQFTASWCGVCRKEMPFIERDIWQRHKDNPDFYLIGIDRDEPLDKVKGLAEATGVTYPLGLDPGAEIYSKYALKESGITRNVLIDRNGIIIQRTRLYKPDEFQSLVNRIDAELAKLQFTTVDVHQFDSLIRSSDIQLVDVRTQEEYATEHIQGATMIEVTADNFKENALKLLDKAKKVAVYCRSGKRSARAAEILTHEGFCVVNLDGGIIKWKENGMQTVR